MSDSILSPIGRWSWVFLHGEGDEKEKGAAKFKGTLMLPKNMEAFGDLPISTEKKQQILDKTAEFVAEVRKQAEELAKANYKGKYQSARYDPVLDGDEKTDTGNYNANFWLLRMKSKFQPQILSPRKADGLIADGNDDLQTGFYSGAWGRCYVSMYPYNVDGNKGIALGLGNIQKAYNDAQIKGDGASFDDDIEDLDPDDADFDTVGAPENIDID